MMEAIKFQREWTENYTCNGNGNSRYLTLCFVCYSSMFWLQAKAKKRDKLCGRQKHDCVCIGVRICV